MVGTVGGLAAPAAAGPVTLVVASGPTTVASGGAVTYTITATNTGAAPASAVTITNDVTEANDPIVPPVGTGGITNPTLSTTTGSCSYNGGQVTCDAAGLSVGQTWTVTVSAHVTSSAGTVLTDAASVSGTESSTDFTATASATTTVNIAAGFTQSQLLKGLKDPIAFAFAQNGDIYIGEESGVILIDRNGALLPTPVISLNVFFAGESGLTGMALDPNFATNGYMYVSYTVPITSKGGTTQVFSQLSRLTVVNGVANPASEKVYFRGNQLQNLHHPGNDIQVGPDGKLWWSVGDNVPSISNAQALSNIYGKILRFNLDGTIPADNPFVNVSGTVPAIYAYGLRNPFRFTFLPNGKVMTEDTGSNFWEELDTIQPGGNYGWPFYEGDCYGCGYINPVYAYGHIPADGAASAIAAYSGSTFPQSYDHVVFVGDYNRGDIEAVAFDPTYQTEVSDTVFDSTAGTIADLQEGPDGDLYYVSIFEGTFSKISPVGPFAPTATVTSTPSAGTGPLTVQFSSAGSSDPYGLPLTYSWNFGDGSAVSTESDPSHTYTANGTYMAKLTVSNGTQTGVTSTTVVVGHTPPSASISAPTSYNAGDTVTFTGSATDANDGTLGASAFSWKVDYYVNGVAQPFYTDEVAHPFDGPFTGVTGGSIQIPSDPSQVPGSFYRITLTVTDSLGLQTVVIQDLHPNLTTWSVDSDVTGAGYVVDGTWQTDTYSTQDVVGVQHVLSGLPLTQTVGGVPYRFAGWADGSALTDTITAGVGSGSYTALFDPVQSTMPSPWQSIDVGAPISAGTADFAPSDQNFYVDGGGADVYGANDQFHYVYQTLNGNGTIVARVRYQTNSSSWAKAGVMITASPTAGAPFVDALVSPDVSPNTPNVNCIGYTVNGCDAPLPPVTPTVGNGPRMQYSSTGSITPATTPAGFSSPDKWVKLQRTGNSFTSWISSDGVNWTQMGTVSLSMGATATIGLFVTSHNIGQNSTVAFDNVQVTQTPPPGPIPSPWVDTDVGSPSPAGSASFNSGVFSVQGSGTDIWGMSDQFNYVSQPTTGNGTMIARVTSQSDTSSNAKAGIMFKQSATAGAPYFLIAAAPGGVVKVQYGFNGSIGGETLAFPNVWVKLARSGNTFTAYLSSDGVNWTNVFHKTLTMTTNATVGLFECSHKTGVLGTATFDNVSFTPGP
jgi:glucose/arabinose dehydrogenase/regulation of enolase protein 1 (concanavalin A-like superfamily)